MLTRYKVYQPSSSKGQTTQTSGQSGQNKIFNIESLPEVILTPDPIPVSPGQEDGLMSVCLSDSVRVFVCPRSLVWLSCVCSIFRGSHLVSVSYSVFCLCPRLPPWLHPESAHTRTLPCRAASPGASPAAPSSRRRAPWSRRGRRRPGACRRRPAAARLRAAQLSRAQEGVANITVASAQAS